jgi:hypothetical protein
MHYPFRVRRSPGRRRPAVRHLLPAACALTLLAAAPAGAVRKASRAFDPDDYPRGAALPGCGTELTPAEAAAYLRHLESREPSSWEGGGPYYVPIAPHIVRMSDGTGGLPVARYEQAVADANGHFAPSGIVFFTKGAIDFIDSDAFYTTSSLDEIDDLRTTNTVADAINIYFTENLNYESGALCGISAFTFSSVQAIAMRNSCTANPAGLGNHSTFSHEIGHYFDLFHTHETAFGDELVDGSNCGVAGDLLCDTPADPRLGSGNVNTACEYTGDERDANNDLYAPDPALLMSYSLKHCRDLFSDDSYTQIEATLLGERTNLITPPGEVVDAPADIAAVEAGLSLSAPRPNPSSGLTEMTFAIDAPAFVTVSVFDVRGALVRTIARAPYGAGRHTVGWDGRDSAGRDAAPGIYFARVQAAGEQVARKIQRVR